MNINFRYYIRRRRRLVLLLISVIIILIWYVYVISEKESPDLIHEEVTIKRENAEVNREIRTVKRSVVHPSERTLRVKEVCKKYSLGRYAPQELKEENRNNNNYIRWVINTKYNIAFSLVQNTGVSFWLYMFVLLGGLSHDQIDFLSDHYKLEHLVSKVSPKLLKISMQEALENSFKIASVRHPFHRLFWIYHDQLKYFDKPNSKNRTGIENTDEQKLKPADDSLSFEQFLISLVKMPKENLNVALQPYYIQLDACRVLYDYIATAETLYDDLVSMSKSVPKLSKFLTPEMKTKSVKYARNSVLVNKYLAYVNTTVLTKVYELYKIDFEMFGYDFVGQYTP